MTSSHAFRTVAGAFVLVMLAAGLPVRGAEQSASQTNVGAQSMVNSYAGPISPNIGTFSGKLVCLRCDIKPGPDAMRECQKEGHRHALSMSDSMIHPLLAVTETVLKQINSGELHDKEVTVHGKYYPSTGFILVDQITLAKEG